MLKLIISITLPPLLVFGLYHLMTWVNILNVNGRVYWKRVALASAVSHALLVTGFFVFTYFDYLANRQFSAFGLGYGDFLFNGSQFWRMVTVFDTASMGVIVGLFAVLDRFGIAFPGLVPVTIAITFVVGTLQWYFLGGGLGALLQKFWSGLKTGDEEEEEWFQ